MSGSITPSNFATKTPMIYGTFGVNDSLTATQFNAVLSEIQKAQMGLLNFGSRLLNVMDFGAKCNGTDDDTAAIQAALNADMHQFSIVYIPGPCKISSSLYVPWAKALVGNMGVRMNAASVSAAGTGLSTLIAASDIVLVRHGHGRGVYGLQLQGIQGGSQPNIVCKPDVTKETAPVDGFNNGASEMDDQCFANLWLLWGGGGVSVPVGAYLWAAQFLNCIQDSANLFAFKSDGQTDGCIFTGCNFFSVPVIFNGANDRNVFANCQFHYNNYREYNGGGAIINGPQLSITNGTNITISGGFINDADSGLYLDNCEGVNLSGVNFKTLKRQAVLINNSKRVIVNSGIISNVGGTDDVMPPDTDTSDTGQYPAATPVIQTTGTCSKIFLGGGLQIGVARTVPAAIEFSAATTKSRVNDVFPDGSFSQVVRDLNGTNSVGFVAGV